MQYHSLTHPSTPNKHFLLLALAFLVINGIFIKSFFYQPQSYTNNNDEDNQLLSPYQIQQQSQWLPSEKGYSLLMATHSKRAKTLLQTLRFYTRENEYPRMNHIYIYWNDKSLKTVPEVILEEISSDPILSSKVKILTVNNPSMLQRLNISQIDPNEISFASFDDDLRVSGQQMEYLFNIHRISPNSMVGYCARYVDWHLDDLIYRWQDPPSVYNLVLVGASFVSRTNLERLWSPAFDKGREYVEKIWNCDDLFMNVVALQPPIAVDSHNLRSIQGADPISSGGDHMKKRHRCLNLFREWYGDGWLKRESDFKIVEWDVKVVERNSSSNSSSSNSS